jgi:hypothetical protein
MLFINFFFFFARIHIHMQSVFKVVSQKSTCHVTYVKKIKFDAKISKIFICFYTYHIDCEDVHVNIF